MKPHVLAVIIGRHGSPVCACDDSPGTTAANGGGSRQERQDSGWSANSGKGLRATTATSSAGAFGLPYPTGLIGQRLLLPFTFILDYANDRIGFIDR